MGRSWLISIIFAMRKFAGFFLLLLVTGITCAGQSLKDVEKLLLKHFQKIEKASTYVGNSDYEVLSKENYALRQSLIKYGTRSDVLMYSFPSLTKKMFITTSKDGNFRAYSWDTETGGTMHDYITVYQYKGRSGKVMTWGTPYSDDISDYGAGAFVHDIFQTKSAANTIYLVVSTFIGSTSLNGQVISAFAVKGDKLNTKAKVIRTKSGLTNSVSFEYDFFSVVDRAERPVKLFAFDEKEKSFRFPVVIQDQTAPQGRVTDKFIMYKFNGKYFVKVS